MLYLGLFPILFLACSCAVPISEEQDENGTASLNDAVSTELPVPLQTHVDKETQTSQEGNSVPEVKPTGEEENRGGCCPFCCGGACCSYGGYQWGSCCYGGRRRRHRGRGRFHRRGPPRGYRQSDYFGYHYERHNQFGYPQYPGDFGYYHHYYDRSGNQHYY